jgi:uncharacterized protein (DUF2062 family)
MTLSPTADAETALTSPRSTGRVEAEVARLRTRSELRIAERSAEVDLGARRDTIKVEARERRRAAADRRHQDSLERKTRRAQRRRLRCDRARRSVAGTVAAAMRNVVLVPILASTCSAWWFQLEAMRAAGLTLVLAATVATALESLGLTFAGLAHQARAVNDSAAVYRVAMWAVVAVSAGVNYRHGSPGWDRPGLTGIVFATLSVGSVVGWELRERQTYRARIAERLPARRPRFGYARWIRFPVTTGRALSVAIRDGLTETTDALSVATAETARRRSLRQTRRAFGRAGRRLIARRLTTARSPVAVSRPDDPPSVAADMSAATVPAGARRRARANDPAPSQPGSRMRVGRRTASDQRGTTGRRPPVSTSATRDRPPGAGRSKSVTASPVAGADGIDISDLLPAAREIATELGDRLSRDSLIDSLRSRGLSVGGRRRKAVYDAVRLTAS